MKVSKRSKKLFALGMSIVLLIGCIVGGTLAWLKDETETVTNTFTTSGIEIKLEEQTIKTEDQNDYHFQMIPGWTIKKDPKVTVVSGSEDCYLFVKVEGTNASIQQNSNGTYSLGEYIVYAVKEDWLPLEGQENVFYRVVDDITSKKGTSYSILGGGEWEDPGAGVKVTWAVDQVATKPSITNEMMRTITSGNQPKLSFTAYATQLWKSNESGGENAKFKPTEAWNLLNPQF